MPLRSCTDGSEAEGTGKQSRMLPLDDRQGQSTQDNRRSGSQCSLASITKMADEEYECHFNSKGSYLLDDFTLLRIQGDGVKGESRI